MPDGIASVLISQCSKCHLIFRCDTSSMMTHNDESHYTINTQAVLGQVATGGGAEHFYVPGSSIGHQGYLYLFRTLFRSCI